MKYLIGSCILVSTQLFSPNVTEAASFTVAEFCTLERGRSSIYAVNYRNAYARKLGFRPTNYDCQSAQSDSTLANQAQSQRVVDLAEKKESLVTQKTAEDS